MLPLLFLLVGQVDLASAQSIREVIPEGATHVVHIRDWHLVSEEDFAADTELDGQALISAYTEHRDLVKKVQTAQRELLAEAKAVHVEGLAPSDMIVLNALIRLQRKSPDDTRQLKLGAAGQLMVEKKLRILPAEAEGFEKANPVRDGKVNIDSDAQEEREDAIVKRLLKHKGKVYLVLGGAHDLTDNIRRLSKDCGYTVVTPKGYPQEQGHKVLGQSEAVDRPCFRAVGVLEGMARIEEMVAGQGTESARLIEKCLGASAGRCV